MLELSAEQQREFRSAVRAAAGRSDLSAAIAAIYADFAAELERRKPICQSSGRCCKFAEFGHRLFITTAEMAVFSAELAQMTRPTLASKGPRLSIVQPTDRCAYQLNNLCTVHTIRPFGCRVFFCDETATDWQREQYEQFHARIRTLHEQLQIPYFYVEWTRALSAVVEEI